MYTNNRILLQTNMFNLEKVEIMKKVFYKSLILAFSATMLSANVNAQFVREQKATRILSKQQSN